MSSSRKRSRNARSPPPTRVSSSQRTSPNRPNIAALTRRAANRFLGLTFEDPISLQRVGRSRGIALNRQMYDHRSLRQLIARGNTRVPHSRRQLTQAEINGIMRDPKFLDRNASNVAKALLKPLRKVLNEYKNGLNDDDDFGAYIEYEDNARQIVWTFEVDFEDLKMSITDDPIEPMVKAFLDIRVQNGVFRLRVLNVRFAKSMLRGKSAYRLIIGQLVDMYHAKPVRVPPSW